MNFRECRIMTVYEILRRAGLDYSVEEVFIKLGAIKNSLYFFSQSELKLFYPNGIDFIIVPYVFDNFHIKYETKSIVEFLNEQKINNELSSEKVYVLPFYSQFKNRKYEGELKNIMIAQSYLPIKKVDFIENKVHLDICNLDIQECWMDIDNLKALFETKAYILQENLNVYIIDLEEVKKSKEIKDFFNRSLEEDLRDICEDFLTDTKKDLGDEVSKRNGPGVYEYIYKNMISMRQAINKHKDSNGNKKVINYILLQLRILYVFLGAGTDGYYRNEFSETLLFISRKLNCEDFAQNAKLWGAIGKKWRKFGRKLDFTKNPNTNIDVVLEKLDYLINLYDEIRKEEIFAIEALDEIVNSTKLKELA